MDEPLRQLFKQNAYGTNNVTNNGRFKKIPSEHINPLHEQNKVYPWRQKKKNESTFDIASNNESNKKTREGNTRHSFVSNRREDDKAMSYDNMKVLEYNMPENLKTKKRLMDPEVPTSFCLPKTKALEIASMEDGITESGQPDIFYVYSNSDNYRMVDMWICTCSCPAGLKPTICSHLYAVAMQNPHFSFRFSLHSFLRYKVNMLKVSSDNIVSLNLITSWIQQKFIKKALQHYDSEQVFMWTLEAFCALMTRLIQSGFSSLPTVLSENCCYNHASDDDADFSHQKKKLRVYLKNVQRKLQDRKISESSVIARFILFFESFGTKATIAVRILKLMVEKKSKRLANKTRRFKKLRSQIMIDVDSSSTEETYTINSNIKGESGQKKCSEMIWDSDQNPYLSMCRWLEYGAHHPEIKEQDVLHVETEADEATQLTSSVSECKSIDFLLYTDEVVKEMTKRKKLHSSYLSLLADVSFTLKERYDYPDIPKGICEILGPRLEMFPEIKKVSTINECYLSNGINESFLEELQKVIHSILPVANGIFNNFDKATDVVKEFLQFPTFFNLLPNQLKDICNEKELVSSNLEFVDSKKLSMLHNQFALFKSKNNTSTRLTSVNHNIKNALESIVSAPFGVSLADVIHWGDIYQNSLGRFKDFIFSKVSEFDKYTLGDIIQIEYNNFIKVPFLDSYQDYIKQMLVDVQKNNILSLWGHCLACLYNFSAAKDEIENFSATLSSGVPIERCIKNELLRCFEFHTSRQLNENTDILIQDKKISSKANTAVSHEQVILLEKISEHNHVESNVDICQPLHQPTTSVNEDECDQSIVSYEKWNDLLNDFLIHELGVSNNQNLTKIEENSRNRLSRAISKLSTEIYSDSFHFVLELIQNADDNIYCETMNKTRTARRAVPGFCMISSQWGIACVNNEKGFRPQDMRALCDIGCSSKLCEKRDTSKPSIGKFGIGFKSVFMYTESPYIFSNNLSLNFDNNNKTGLGALAPQLLKETWRTICPEVVVKIVDSCGIQDSTVFWLPKTSKHSNSCTFLENVSPLWILFLNQLETLMFYDLHSYSYMRVTQEICRHEDKNACNPCALANLPAQYQHIKIKIIESGLAKDTFSNVECVEKELHFVFAKDNESNLCVAYFIDHKNWLFEPMSSNLCVYLPVKNIGLKFPVHGEFRLTTTRENILIDDSENIILLKKLGSFIAESISHLSDLVNQSILQLLPLREELDSSLCCVAESAYHTLVATLKIPQLCSKKKISTMKDVNFVLPPSNVLSQESNNNTLITTNQRLLNQLFKSLALLDLEDSCDETRTFRPIVDITFIQKATLNVCSSLLRIPFLNAWDIVDRLSVFEKILKKKKFVTEKKYDFWSKVIGGFFIILNTCLESQNNNFVFLHLFDILKRLSIYPIKCLEKEKISTENVFMTLIRKSENPSCEKTVIYIPWNETTLDETTTRLKAIAEDSCHVLNPSFFLWNELSENSHALVSDDQTQNIYKALNYELQAVLSHLNVYCINDPRLLEEYFLPLLRTPGPTIDKNLVSSLAFVLVREMNGVDSLIYHTSFLNEERKEELKKKLADLYVLTNESVECKRKLGTQSFLSRTGEFECRETCDILLLIPCMLTLLHNSNEAQNIFMTIGKQRSGISNKYWSKNIKDNNFFWDEFFHYWGAQSFWYLQNIDYTVEISSKDHIHITLHDCPPFLCSSSTKIITKFLNTEFSVNRFRDQNNDIVYPVSIQVEDTVCIEFLKILRLLHLCDISSFKINDSSMRNLFKLLSLLCEKMYHLLCAAQPAKTSNNKEVLNSFILQLQCLPWIPGFRVQKNMFPIASITDSIDDYLKIANMQLLPPMTLLKHSSNNFETAKSLCLLTSTELSLTSNFLDFTVATSFHLKQIRTLFFSKLCISQNPSIDLLMLLLGTLVDKIIKNDLTFTYGSDPSCLKISLLQQYLDTLKKIYYISHCSQASNDDIDRTYQQKLITLFNEKKLVLVYNSTEQCWFNVSLKNLFWSFPTDFELQSLMCSFSFINNALIQMHASIPAIINMSPSQQHELFKQDKKDFAIFFNKILEVSKTPNIQQLILDIECIRDVSETFSLTSSKNTDLERNVTHIVQCLRAIYLIKHEDNVPSVHVDSKKLNDYLKRISTVYSEQRIISVTSKKSTLNWSNDVTQKVIPVLTLSNSVEFISFTEAQSDPYVTIVVTHSDETARRELAKFGKQSESPLPYKYILGCFKLAYGESKNALQQKWWNNICMNLVQYPSLSYTISQQYAGQESIKFFKTRINLQFKANFSYLIIFLAFPLITRYFLCTNPETINDFCQENSAETVFKQISCIRFGFITSLVCCRWFSTIDERFLKNINTHVAACSANCFEMCLIVSLGSVSSNAHYPEILEKMLVYLFPFCKKNSVIFYIVTMITSFATLEDVLPYNDPSGNFKFPHHLETILTTLADIPLLSNKEILPFLNNVSNWFLQLQSLWIHDYKTIFEGLSDLNILEDILSYVNSTSSYDEDDQEKNEKKQLLEDEACNEFQMISSNIFEKEHANSNIHEAVEEEHLSGGEIECINSTNNSGDSLDLHSACVKYNAELIAHKKITDDLLPESSSEVYSTARVGRVGEELAYRYLLTTYDEEIESKRLSVTWVNKQRESGLPYDILLKYHTPQSVNGEEVYVEVKSTSWVSKAIFKITNSEWRFAQLQGDNYHIYRIFGVNCKHYSILKVQNPYKEWRNRNMQLYLSF